MRIAAVFTAYNRKVLTLACLSSLEREIGAEIDVYMLDDGSTDGTGDAVRRAFPKVRVLEGDGSYFWARGMAVALKAAQSGDYDFYLWLNDDVALDEGFLGVLLRAHAQADRPEAPAVVVGATRDSRGRVSYGGHVRRASSPLRLDFSLMPASPDLQPCDSFSGNCVLAPREVVRRIGAIDGRFFHNFADFDYGLRAARAGATLWQAPGTIGVCEVNTKKARHAEALRFGRWPARWRAFWDPSSHHMPSRLRYYSRHLGPFGVVAALSTMRYLLPFAARGKLSDVSDHRR